MLIFYHFFIGVARISKIFCTIPKKCELSHFFGIVQVVLSMLIERRNQKLAEGGERKSPLRGGLFGIWCDFFDSFDFFGFFGRRYKSCAWGRGGRDC